MKTTLDGVVFLLPHVSGHAKTEFHRRRIFPRPREEGGNGMRRPGESCRTRTVGRQDEAAERGSKMDSRTERQDGAQNKAAEQGGKTDRQNEAFHYYAIVSANDGEILLSCIIEYTDNGTILLQSLDGQPIDGNYNPITDYHPDYTVRIDDSGAAHIVKQALPK